MGRGPDAYVITLHLEELDDSRLALERLAGRVDPATLAEISGHLDQHRARAWEVREAIVTGEYVTRTGRLPGRLLPSGGRHAKRPA